MSALQRWAELLSRRFLRPDFDVRTALLFGCVMYLGSKCVDAVGKGTELEVISKGHDTSGPGIFECHAIDHKHESRYRVKLLRRNVYREEAASALMRSKLVHFHIRE